MRRPSRSSKVVPAYPATDLTRPASRNSLAGMPFSLAPLPQPTRTSSSSTHSALPPIPPAAGPTRSSSTAVEPPLRKMTPADAARPVSRLSAAARTDTNDNSAKDADGAKPASCLSLAPTTDEAEDEFATLRIFVGTWNMHGKDPPEDLSPWLGGGEDRYDLYVVGTQEACRSIEMSLLLPSKAKWEMKLRETLGDGYVCVATNTLAAIHLALFARRSLMDSIGCVRTAQVATGIANTLGNKGGVGISLTVGQTSLLLINSHLAAHQNAVDQRNSDYLRIDSQMSLRPPSVLIAGERDSVAAPPLTSFKSVDSVEDLPVSSTAFDVCIWLGDLNYRIQGNRAVVDKLLAPATASRRMEADWQGEESHWRSMCEVLLANDQLNQERRAGHVFVGFEEAPITFRPTYKYDKDSDVYDTSEKCRIPAYTDRILFRSRKPGHVRAIRYAACDALRTSDHRPVLAHLVVMYKEGVPILTSEERARERRRRSSASDEVTTTQSTVCSVM